MTDILYIDYIYIKGNVIQYAKKTNNYSTCIVMHIFTRMYWNIQWNLHKFAISNLQSESSSHMSNVVHNRGTKHFITKLRMNICKINSSNHRTIESIINCHIFCHFASTYRKSSAIFKKLARSTPVFFDRRDRCTLARLPRSNEAIGRVTKGQVAQLVYNDLANEVVPLFLS